MPIRSETVYIPQPHRLYFGMPLQTPNAALLGGGTNANPLEDSGSLNFLDFRTKSTAASGDIRGLYIRHYLSGGAGGECSRFYTTVEAAAGTAHGSHISLGFGASPATLSGLGVAMRGTLHIPNRAITLGTVAAVQAEVYMDGTSANPTATELSLYRGIVDGGDATAKARIKNFLNLSCSAGSGNMFETGLTAATVNAATTTAIKIRVNGTNYWIPVATAIS